MSLLHSLPGSARRLIFSLCKLCVLCVSVVLFQINEPQRHREHRACTEKNVKLGHHPLLLSYIASGLAQSESDRAYGVERFTSYRDADEARCIRLIQAS